LKTGGFVFYLYIIYMEKFDNFIIERHHVNQDVRHLTKLIYDKVNYYLPKLILNKEVVINNLLQDKYFKLKFKNDKIVLRLGNNHGGINSPMIKNDVIEDLNIYLTIKLSDIEIKNKYLKNNKISGTINHECQHVIELYHSKDNLSKSWSFHDRLKEHDKKFSEFDNWLGVTHLFYLCEDHEIRSSISQMSEYIKDKNDNNIEFIIKNSDIYKKYDYISKVVPVIILKKMRTEYDEFDSILNDFIKNVVVNNSDNLDSTFEKEIHFLNKRAKNCVNKLLNISKNFIRESRGEYFEESCDKIIDYSKYL